MIKVLGKALYTKAVVTLLVLMLGGLKRCWILVFSHPEASIDHVTLFETGKGNETLSFAPLSPATSLLHGAASSPLGKEASATDQDNTQRSKSYTCSVHTMRLCGVNNPNTPDK
jgi:hypothetical protein